MPYSPNWISVCPRDSPARRPRCCLRCLTRFGDSIYRPPPRGPPPVPPPPPPPRPRPPRPPRPPPGPPGPPGPPPRPPGPPGPPPPPRPPRPPPPPAPPPPPPAPRAPRGPPPAPPGPPPPPPAPAPAAAAAPAPAAAPAAAIAAVLALLLRSLHLGEVGARVALGHDLALVDPALHADAPECRAGLVEAVVDVGAHRVQRDAAIRVALPARHLGAAEAPGDLHLAALRARAHGARQRALHRAAERDSVLQLLGDRLRYELRIELGALDLEDVDLDLLARHPVEVLAQGVDLAAGLADHDARTRGVDVDLHLVRVLADRDVAEPRVRQLADDVAADRDVLGEVVGEVALVEPVRLPVVDVAHAHRLGMNLLSHQLLLRRERDREVARALADARRAAHGARTEALQRRPLVGGDGEDEQVVADQLVVVLGVGDRGLEHLAPVARHRAGRVREDRAGLLHGLAADVVAHEARLARRGADVLGLRAHEDELAVAAGGRLALRRGGRRRGRLLGVPAAAAAAAPAPAAARGRGRVGGVGLGVGVGL